MDLIEDKPETEKCDGALRRSTGCFNQQSLLDQATQNVSQQSSNQLPSQPKSTLSRKVNTGQQAKSQRSNSSVNLLTSISVPMCTASQNRTLQQVSALSDHALTKVNAGQTSSKTLAAEIRPSLQPYRFRPSSPHVWAELILQGARTKSDERRRCVLSCCEMLSNFACIYIHHWGV